MAQAQAITPEVLETLLQADPSLRETITASLDARIDALQSARAAVAGSTKASAKRKSSSGTRVKRGLHGEMAIKVLASLGATGPKTGVPSGDVKEAASKFDHDFGSALNATLDGLGEKGIVGYENVSDTKKPRYNFWLAMPEDKAIAKAAEAAKAGRKPSKK